MTGYQFCYDLFEAGWIGVGGGSGFMINLKLIFPLPKLSL